MAVTAMTGWRSARPFTPGKEQGSLSLAIWRLAWRALQLGRGYSGNSAPDSAQEQPSHTVDQRKWTVTAAGLAAEFDNDNSLTDAWAIFPSRAALRHATWLVPCLYSSENVQQQIDPGADVRDCFVER